jgi:flavin reductase (DIM6/NTAB) family NADH-FMN oxidoreductase RutF
VGKVVKELDAGTHTIFIGAVMDTQVFKEGKPVTYAYYHQVKRGITPKTAPYFGTEK